MKRFVLILFLFAFVCFFSCKKDIESDKNDNRKGHKDWSYDGETSPEHWDEIFENSDCGGEHQSPINIVEAKTIKSETEFNSSKILYDKEIELKEVKNNGHTIEFDFDKGDSIHYINENYQLIQLHFHEPSEHTINGIRYPIEIHLVHKSTKNNLTVLSVLAKEGNESQLFEFFESFLPLKKGEYKVINKTIDLTTLFPVSKDYYSYSGSLTTPPCTENVNWVIFKQPIVISLDEVLRLKNTMPINNYRTEQPLNNRIVYINYENK